MIGIGFIVANWVGGKEASMARVLITHTGWLWQSIHRLQHTMEATTGTTGVLGKSLKLRDLCDTF